MSTSSEFDYKKYLQLVKRKKRLFVFVALAIMTGSVAASYLLPKKYAAKSTVFIEKSVISELVKGIAVTPSVEDKIKVLTYAMSSRSLLLKVIDELDLNVRKQSDAELEEMVKEFQKGTEIKLRDKEGLFIISFTHEKPRIARDYVNILVRRYIEENISSKREESYGATKFLSEQISTFKGKLDEAEKGVNDFKREKVALLAADNGSIQREINDAQIKMEEIRIRKNQLESMRSLMIKADPLRERLTFLQKRLEELRQEYTDSYPEVIRVKAEIESVKDQLGGRRGGPEYPTANPQDLEKIDVELKSHKAIEANLRAQMAENRALLRGIPVARANLEQLEQERINRKTIYEQLYARHGQSEVSKQMEVQDKTTTFRIIDPAVMPIKPVSPNRVMIILMGIAAGLAGGVGVLLCLDYLDRSVRSVDTLKSLGVPVLAVIPKMTDPGEELVQRKKDMRLYLAAGVYLSMILAVLALEALNVSAVDKVIGRIQGMF